MIKNFRSTGFYGLLVILLFACNNAPEKNEKAEAVIAAVRQEYAPDKRVVLFSVESRREDGQLILTGETNNAKALEDLRGRFKEENISYTDSIRLLPEGEIKNTSRALVRISVANLRSKPAHSSELATQATLGTPLKVLKKEEDWYLVQTPDDYLSWVDSGGIELLTDEAFTDWKKAEKLIYTAPFGFAYREPAEAAVVADLVAGSVLELTGEEKDYYRVSYPANGEIAYVKKQDSEPYEQWLTTLAPNREKLVETSMSLMGLPYLWGGTSTKGVDCSGFTKTIFFMNGQVIPRDASQQVHTGELVDANKDWDKLTPGDLLFFGTPATDSTAEKVVHVGMWIGNNSFIHSSGRVRVSSVDKDSPEFDEFNYNRYLRTKRVFGETEGAVFRLAGSGLYGETEPAVTER